MQFRIGTKISLLTCTMVLAGSWFLSELVMQFCARHVVDHEVVDLVDETNVSAQRMRRRADELREELTDLAEQLTGEACQELYDARASAADPLVPPARIQREFSRLLKRQRDVLQVEIRAWSPGQAAADTTPVATTRRATVQSFSLPVGQTAFLDSVLAMRPHVAQLSPFTQAEVTYHRGQIAAAADGVEPEVEEEVPIDGRKLILLGGTVIANPEPATATTPERPGLLLLVVEHFSQLDSDTSNEDQVSTSPRHFLFLLDQDRRFLAHPDPDFIADLSRPAVDEPQKSLSHADPEIRAQFDEIDRLMKLPNSSPEVQSLQEYGRTVTEKRLPSLDSWFGFTRPVPHGSRLMAVFDDLDFDPANAGDRELRRRLERELNEYVLDHPEYKLSAPNHYIPRFKIRSQSRHSSDLLPLQQRIHKVITGAGLEDPLTWESPVHLQDFALHLLRLPYEPHHPERYLDLIVAVSYQEIASDVEAEMFWIRMGAIACSLGAGGLAVLFSLIITRPLNKIITSTRRLAHGEFDLVLPVHDRGEVGVLARSFKVMVEQLLERRRALQEEQAKIRHLNADLKRERDLLDVRVRERTLELLKTNSDLEAARDTALEASRAKSAFLAQMSHELRTPLNAIIGYGELLTEEFADGPAAVHLPDLQKIIDSGRHLLGLINDILDLSKVEAGKMELELETFEVRPVVETVVTTVQPLVLKNKNRLTWDVAPAVRSLRADRMRVRQILLNLLSNALKFTSQGEVELTVTVADCEGRECVVFRVRDTGVGMTAEQMQRLFQNFSQADASTTRKYGGTGLGLAICKRFCEMLEGRIAVVSEYQHGSTFTVTLPVTGPASPAAGAGKTSSATAIPPLEPSEGI